MTEPTEATCPDCGRKISVEAGDGGCRKRRRLPTEPPSLCDGLTIAKLRTELAQLLARPCYSCGAHTREYWEARSDLPRCQLCGERMCDHVAGHCVDAGTRAIADSTQSDATRDAWIDKHGRRSGNSYEDCRTAYDAGRAEAMGRAQPEPLRASAADEKTDRDAALDAIEKRYVDEPENMERDAFREALNEAYNAGLLAQDKPPSLARGFAEERELIETVRACLPECDDWDGGARDALSELEKRIGGERG